MTRSIGRAAVFTGAGLALLLAAFFAPVLFHGRQFCYRDATYFYYPLYERVQQEWEHGRWPLWEPEENAGTPLLGNPTAAVLYPGKIVYALLPYPWATRWYVIGHVALAFLTMRWLLRGWRLSQEASALGALSFAFGAPVLFQYCNVVFLVGAAWMPLGFRAADSWIRLGRRWAPAELAVVLALQTLGGDPEAAYLTVLGAFGYAIADAAARQNVSPRGGRIVVLVVAMLLLAALLFGLQAAGRSWPIAQRAFAFFPFALWGSVAVFVSVRWRTGGASAWFSSRVLGMGAASALALLLVAAQLLPTVEFLAQSSRADSSVLDIYRFSLSPARLAGSVWPNVAGSVGAGEDVVSALVPQRWGRNEAWVPSVYLGSLCLLLAAAGAGFGGRQPWRGWLTAVALIAGLASLGEYGSPLFWARCVSAWWPVIGPHDQADLVGFRTDALPRDGDGSVYWLLTAALPGFRSFRYPSKLLTLACLATSGLAAIGWDRAVTHPPRLVLRAGLALTVLVLLLALGSMSTSGPLAVCLEAAQHWLRPSDRPSDPVALVKQFRPALWHAALAWGVSLVLVRGLAQRRRFVGIVALAVASLDLFFANAPLIQTMPQRFFDERPRVLNLIEAEENTSPEAGPFRIHRPLTWAPPEGPGAGTEFEGAELERWKRATVEPITAIAYGYAYTYTAGTSELALYKYAMSGMTLPPTPQLLRERRVRPGQRIVYHPRRWYDLWGTRYFIVPTILEWGDLYRDFSAFVGGTEVIYPPRREFAGPGGDQRRARWRVEQDWQLLRNREAYPRAWVVHQARFHRPTSAMNDKQLEAVYNEITYQADALWYERGRPVFDPRRVAWLEADRQNEVRGFLSRAASSDSESVRVDSVSPQRVVLDVSLRSAGLVILADVFYPGWRLTIDGKPAESLRANLLMRGAAVPAGRHTLVYSYEPASFRVGLALSAVGAIFVLGYGVWCFRTPAGASQPAVEPGRPGAKPEDARTENSEDDLTKPAAPVATRTQEVADTKP